MIDIFVPTCARDAEQTRLMLRSLDTYLDVDAVRTLTLAAVDTADFAAEFARLDAGKFHGKVRKLRLGDLGLSEFDGTYDRGWDLQQAAKLVYARHSTSDFFMVLDSKNLALQPVGIGDLVVDGRAPQILEVQAIHHKWWRGSCWALAHKKFDRADGRMVLSSATPVMFHTASLREMLDFLEKRHKESIEQFFMRWRPIRHRLMRPTEFTMYHVWMDKQGRVDRHHFPSTMLQDTAAQIWESHGPHVRAERFERIASRQTRGFFTGIARGAWQSLSDAQRAEVQRLASGS